MPSHYYQYLYYFENRLPIVWKSLFIASQASPWVYISKINILCFKGVLNKVIIPQSSSISSDILIVVSYRHCYYMNAQPAARRSCIQPSVQIKNHKKLLVNDGDFMNEFKLRRGYLL